MSPPRVESRRQTDGTDPEGRWPHLPVEQLAPQILLASFYAYSRPFTPRVHIPGLNIYLVTDGKARFTCSDGTSGVAAKGDVMSFYYGTNSYEAVGSTPLSIYQVVFLPAPPPMEGAVPFLDGCGVLPHRVAVGERAGECVEAYERMMTSLLRLGATWRLETAAAILSLLHVVFSAVAARRAYRPQRLNKWERLLARLETEPRIPEVRELAGDMDMSVQHFIREFRRYMGKTPKQYLLQRRLWSAKRLLAQGALVKEAAYACGFSDPLYFSRLYRSRYGCAPSRADRGTPVDSPEHTSALPVCRHLLAPGVDLKIFTATS